MGISFVVILGIVLWVLLAFWPAIMARKKGYSFVLFALIAIFISFLLALVIVALLKDKNETAQDRADKKAVDQEFRNE